MKGTGVEDEVEEGVQRVLDAIAGLAEIPDPKARALVAVRLLREWPAQSRLLREIRRGAVLELLDRPDGSVRKVAKDLKLAPSTVQDIAAGHSRWGQRPKKQTEGEPGEASAE